MPSFQFRLEGNAGDSPVLQFDLPDEKAISLIARRAACRLASREIETGILALGNHVIVMDQTGTEVARFPLTQFLSVA